MGVSEYAGAGLLTKIFNKNASFFAGGAQE
jgi:hypothetical protein